MRVRTARKLLNRAATSNRKPPLSKVKKALSVIWHRTRYTEGDSIGKRMSSSVPAKTLATVATALHSHKID